MSGNEQDLARDIGTDLQERLPVEQTLPATFIALLADLDAAESRQATGTGSKTE